MNKLIVLFIALVPSYVFSQDIQITPVRIAVVDTGFNAAYAKDVKLCQYGHKDFSGRGKYEKTSLTVDPVPVDGMGHGTNVVGLIDAYARLTGVNYCIVIIKFYDPKTYFSNPLGAEVSSINYATDIGAELLNLSLQGLEYSEKETASVKRYIDHHGVAVAAAGNYGFNIDLPSNRVFPALSDPRVVVVGNIDAQGNQNLSSNYGKRVNRWENGTNRTSLGIVMSGTSQATAVATGKLVSLFFKENSTIKKIAKIGR